VDLVCAKMGVEREEMLHAIHTAGDNDALKIAYNLVRDSQRMKELSESKHDGDGDRGMFTDAERKQHEKPSDGMAPLEELPTMGMYISQSKTGVSAQPVSRSTKKSRWHLGIRSRSQPYDVMSEVYRAMKSVDLLKVSLQLYKVDDRHFLLDFKNLGQSAGEKETYENSGSVAMGFFELCAILIRELAVGGGGSK
ncbi:hypothetical protein, variant, partial [Sphaeroforma arctica JP610]